MQIIAFLGLCALAHGVAVPKSTIYALHEKRATEPLNWEKRSRVDSNALLPLRIGLVQSNLNQGPTLLDEVSSPGHEKYGHHYTVEEVHQLFAPRKESVDTVKEWLYGAGINPDRVSQSVNKQWIQLDATVEEVENLIQTEYYHYEHTRTGKTNVGCDQYHVPEHVTSHVDYITPGLKLLTPSMPKERIEKRTSDIAGTQVTTPRSPLKTALPMPLASLLAFPLGSMCQKAIMPQCIKTMYNITTPPTKAAPGNELGIFEITDTYSQTDLNDFFQNLAPNIPQGTHPTLDSIDGATAPVQVAMAGGESDLDFQISYPIIYPQNTVLFQSDSNIQQAKGTSDGVWDNFLDAIDGSYCSNSGSLKCGAFKPTNVISISYGGQENDFPASYQQRQCNEFLKLGLQGISVLVASGDSGVAGRTKLDNGCLGSKGTIFSPDYPASCPYLTTVGATFLPPGSDIIEDQETAVTRFYSGGGFSNIYPIPSYQAAAVAKYFATSNPPYKSYSSTGNKSFGANDGIYNRLGRGYPDVSAIGDNVVIFNKGESEMIGGTSAAAPVFAAVLNRINEERLAKGLSTVGFVNPVLYQNPGALHDITSGSNPGCGTNGFSAAKGWDPVTGLGTPNYPALLELFMNI